MPFLGFETRVRQLSYFGNVTAAEKLTCQKCDHTIDFQRVMLHLVVAACCLLHSGEGQGSSL